MPKLCAFGCKNNNDVPMHVFPNPDKFPDRFNAWVTLVGGKLKTPSDYTFYKQKLICDIHFEDVHRNRFNRLNVLAVPTLHLQETKNTLQTPTTCHNGVMEHNNETKQNIVTKYNNLATSMQKHSKSLATYSRNQKYIVLTEAIGTAAQEEVDRSSGNKQKLDTAVQEHVFSKVPGYVNSVTANDKHPEQESLKNTPDLYTSVRELFYSEPTFTDNIETSKAADPDEFHPLLPDANGGSLEPDADVSAQAQAIDSDCDEPPVEDGSDVPEAERTIHSGFKCNSCLGEIVGFRYRCVQCADYDLCPRCESSAAHAAHYVLRVPRPAPPAEVRGVLAAVRLALRLPPAADLGPEVKEEPDCVDLAEEVHEAPETAACRVDPLELDAVNQNELEYSSEAETEPRPETTEPPAKKLRPIILKHVQKTPRLDPGTLGHRSQPDTLNAAGASDVRKNYLNQLSISTSTLHTLQPDPLKPNVYKLVLKKPVTNAPKPVAGQPEARRPILVSPRGSTAAAASGGAGGLPIVRLSRLPGSVPRPHQGRQSAQQIDR